MTPPLKPTAHVVLALLSDHQWHSAIEIIEGSHQTSGDRRARELKAAGYTIEKRRIRLASGKLSHAYAYRLLPTSPPSPDPRQATLPLTIPTPPAREYGPP